MLDSRSLLQNRRMNSFQATSDLSEGFSWNRRGSIQRLTFRASSRKVFQVGSLSRFGPGLTLSIALDRICGMRSLLSEYEIHDEPEPTVMLTPYPLKASHPSVRANSSRPKRDRARFLRFQLCVSECIPAAKSDQAPVLLNLQSVNIPCSECSSHLPGLPGQRARCLSGLPHSQNYERPGGCLEEIRSRSYYSNVHIILARIYY